MTPHNRHSAMLIVIACLINECVGASNILLQDISKVDAITARLANAIAHVSKTHFRGNGPILHLVPPEQDKFMIFDIFDRLLQHLSQFFSVLAEDEFHYSNTDAHVPFSLPSRIVKVVQSPNIYIIPMKGENEFQRLDSVLNTLNLCESFNPRGIFILIKTIVECGIFDQFNVSSLYFAHLWKKNCMTVVLLVFSECDLQLTVVSGKPFSKENPCRTPVRGGLSHSYFTSNDAHITLNISKANVTNFNRCLFTAGTIPAPPFTVATEVQSGDETEYNFVGGLEMEIKDVMSNKYNLTVKLDVSNGYTISSLMSRNKNGTEAGIAADIKNHKIDFALGGVSPNYRTFYRFDFSHTYKFSSFSWYVPNANTAPRWQIILKTLSLDVWILSAVFLLLVTSLYYIMELHNYQRQKTNKFAVTSITFIELLCVGLGLSSTQKPIGCLKVLFFSWAAFGLHWSMAYSAMLFDLLRNPPLEKEILTIQDLQNSGLKVVSPTLYFQLFRGVDIDSVTRSVLSNKIDCLNLNVCIKQFVTQRNMSLMDRSEHVDYSVNFKVSKIHKLSENLISFGVSLMANKGNPLSLVMNEVVLRAFETGLVGKWETETWWKFNNEKNTMESFSDDDSALSLSVWVLQGAFLILFVGLLLSLLMFLGEILIYYYKK